MFLLILCIAVIIFLYFLTLPFKYWKNKNVPHPPVSYIFGNIGQATLLRKSIREVYDEIYKSYPELSYVGLYKTRRPSILLRDPILIKDVLLKNFNCFHDNDININEKTDLFAKNAFASKGHLWKKIRNQTAPSFTPKRIKEMLPLLEAAAKNLLTHINTVLLGSKEGAEVKELCGKYTMDAVASCALGLEANSFKDPNSEYLKMIKKVLEPAFFSNIKLLLLLNFPFLSRLFGVKMIPDEVAAYYKTLITKTLEYRTKNKIYRGDFLDTMNELSEKAEIGDSTNDYITAHVLSFFGDGTETSAIVLSFVLYELALNSDVQENLRREIDETLQQNNGQFTYEAIQEMEYLDQVVNESMRKNTAVPTFTRLCTEQFTFEGPFPNGHPVTIEPGTPLIIPVYNIHHDPQYYPNPNLFDPTRFADNNREKHHKYAFLPFGEGPRICVGQRFGIIQIKLAILHVIANYEISINMKTAVPYKMDPHYFLLAAKGGVWLDFCKRRQ